MKINVFLNSETRFASYRLQSLLWSIVEKDIFELDKHFGLSSALTEKCNAEVEEQYHIMHLLNLKENPTLQLHHF